MEQLIRELIEAVKNLGVDKIGINTIISALSLVAALFAVFYSVRSNKKIQKENSDQTIIAIQDKIPLLVFENAKADNQVPYGRAVNNDEPHCYATTQNGEKFYAIDLNINAPIGSIIHCKNVWFEIKNISSAIFKSIGIERIVYAKPKHIKDNTLYQQYENIQLNQSVLIKGIYQKNDKIKLRIRYIFASDEYLKYYSLDSITIGFLLKMTLISDFVYYQTVLFEGDSDIHYNHSKKLIKISHPSESHIYIASDDRGMTEKIYETTPIEK